MQWYAELFRRFCNPLHCIASFYDAGKIGKTELLILISRRYCNELSSLMQRVSQSSACFLITLFCRYLCSSSKHLCHRRKNRPCRQFHRLVPRRNRKPLFHYTRCRVMALVIVVQTRWAFCLKIFPHLFFLERPVLLRDQASLVSR